MRWSYLIAVVANRGIALLGILALSHLMTASEFGIYSLIAVNALMASTLAGTWIATSATRLMATEAAGRRNFLLGRIGGVVGVMLGLQLALAATAALGLLVFGRAQDVNLVAATLLWAMATIIYDVTLAAKNGLSADSSYMVVSITRNTGAMLLCVAAALVGAPVFWVAMGQVAGIALALLSSSKATELVRAALRKAPDPLGSGAPSSGISLQEMLRFGWTGTLALSLLVLINSIARNAIAHWMGEGAAGTYALVSDLLFAPITLLATSYSLSRMASLYKLADAPAEDRSREHRQFIAVIGWLVIPYGVAGYLAAADLVAIFLPAHMRADAISVAPWSMVQAALISMIFAHTTLMLTAQRKRHVWQVAIAALIAFSVASLVAVRSGDLLLFAMAMAGAAIVSLCVSTARMGMDAAPVASLMKSGVAAVGMAAAMIVPLPLDGIVGTAIRLFLGLMIYVAISGVLKPIKLSEILPRRGQPAPAAD